ncbi:hypothetical protein FACS1894201_11450 [Bacteroidia bacterium]|nr:hypothetical protein FACS1894201_11450 [Bacteroidia bacterium]
MITVFMDVLAEYHGLDVKSVIAPMPLIVKVSLFRVAVTSVEVGVPMFQV